MLQGIETSGRSFWRRPWLKRGCCANDDDDEIKELHYCFRLTNSPVRHAVVDWLQAFQITAVWWPAQPQISYRYLYTDTVIPQLNGTHTQTLRKESRLKTKNNLHWSGLYTLLYRFMYLRHASTQRCNTVTMATAVVSIEMVLVACSLAMASLLVFLQGSWTLQQSAVATMVSTKCLSLVEQKRIQWARERGEFEFSSKK